MATLWRLFRAAHGPGLDGAGAFFTSGRWNALGQPTVYFGACAAIAVLERLAHTDSDLVPADLRLGLFEYPDTIACPRVETLYSLPPDWGRNEAATRHLGKEWRNSGTSCMLAVPSVVLPEERNVVFNPQHPDARLVRIVKERPFCFDVRVI